jgi:hypothetical protein
MHTCRLAFAFPYLLDLKAGFDSWSDFIRHQNNRDACPEWRFRAPKHTLLGIAGLTDLVRFGMGLFHHLFVLFSRHAHARFERCLFIRTELREMADP